MDDIALIVEVIPLESLSSSKTENPIDFPNYWRIYLVISSHDFDTRTSAIDISVQRGAFVASVLNQVNTSLKSTNLKQLTPFSIVDKIKFLSSIRNNNHGIFDHYLPKIDTCI